MGGYFCIGFLYLILKGKSLLEYTILFSPKKYENSDKIILKYFQQLETKNAFYEQILKKVVIQKFVCIKYNQYIKFKHPKISNKTSDKTLVLPIACNKCSSKDKKIFIEDESIELLGMLGLVRLYREEYQIKILSI